MRLVTVGDSGEPVRDIQGRLDSLGYPHEPDPRGEFGDGTAAAVRRFQTDRGLDPDAVVERVETAVADAPGPTLVQLNPETLTALADPSVAGGLVAIDRIRQALDGWLRKAQRVTAQDQRAALIAEYLDS